MTSQDGSSAEAENPTLSLSWWQEGSQEKRVKEPWQWYPPPKQRGQWSEARGPLLRSAREMGGTHTGDHPTPADRKSRLS